MTINHDSIGSESTAAVEFCGELTPVTRTPFTIGRDADVCLDDTNLHLHRHLLQLTCERGVWLLANVGTRLTATVSDVEGRLEALLAPGGLLPLAVAHTMVRCTAGPTSYELSILLSDPAFRPGRRIDDSRSGAIGAGTGDIDATVGRIDLTPDQFILIVALAEPMLRGAGRAATSIQTSQQVAQRLGWTVTKLNRKLDNVCQKFSAHGVRGLHGDSGALAANRRARLVEYATAIRLVTREDLELLDLNRESNE